MKFRHIAVAAAFLISLVFIGTLVSDRFASLLGISGGPSQERQSRRLGPTVELKSLEEASGINRVGRLLVVGDSYSVARPWREALKKNLPDVQIVFSSRGGSTLADQYEMLESRKRLVGWPLLIMDGGLTDRFPLDEIRHMVAAQQPQCNLWFYVEPVRREYKNNRVQTGRNRQHERVVSEMQADFPEHLIQWIAELSQDQDGSIEDAVDIEAGFVPRSLRKDKLHLNAEGYEKLAEIIAQRMQGSNLANSCG